MHSANVHAVYGVYGVTHRSDTRNGKCLFSSNFGKRLCRMYLVDFEQRLFGHLLFWLRTRFLLHFYVCRLYFYGYHCIHYADITRLIMRIVGWKRANTTLTNMPIQKRCKSIQQPKFEIRRTSA